MNALFPPPDIPTIRLRVLSLGAGVQSTTLALMAARGEIGPMPDCAIFADTGWEPKAVYEHLAWLRSPNVLPFPVHIVTAGNIRDGLVRGAQGERWASIPAFTKSASGKVGMIRRQCTKELKIVPIRRKVRELVGLTGKRSPDRPVVEQWIGISLLCGALHRSDYVFSRAMWADVAKPGVTGASELLSRYITLPKGTSGHRSRWVSAQHFPSARQEACREDRICPSPGQWAF